MKFDFQFSNLCGTVYRCGNVLFSEDGNSLYSPVGNRITRFHLKDSLTETFAVENRKDIDIMALSPSTSLLLSVDVDGRAILINIHRKVIISHFNFKGRVTALKFSPDSKYIASAVDGKIKLWRAPTVQIDFAPFVLLSVLSIHSDDIFTLDWSKDSQFIVSGSRDRTIRVVSLKVIPGYAPYLLTGHKYHVVSVHFDKTMKYIFSIDQDGALFVWKWEAAVDQERNKKKKKKKQQEIDENGEEKKPRQAFERNNCFGKWNLVKRIIFTLPPRAKVVSTDFNKASGVLVVGNSGGTFSLYEVSEMNDQIECNELSSLSISQHKINSVAINSSSQWLALASKKMGQLVVWEWTSESYILKQQGHSAELSCLSFSPDSRFIATGGDDGKVKVWNTSTGFCFITFNEHQSKVTGVKFSQVGNAIFTSSHDGTVRAFDLTRYRNFRTLTPPEPRQFSSVTVDPSGELVSAGCVDNFEIYVWNVQTSQLLETLSMHTAPVSCLAFNPVSAILCSGSWDKTVRVWDIFDRESAGTEGLTHKSEVLALCFRPDGKQLCSSMLNAELVFWDLEESTITSTIEGKNTIKGGRTKGSARTSQNSDKAFTTICYTPDGKCLLAGGESKFVHLYEIEHGILLRRFQMTKNLSLDGMFNFLGSSNMTEFGPLDSFDDYEYNEGRDDEIDEWEHRKTKTLPGVIGEKQTLHPIARTRGVEFAPTGTSWGAVTSTGLLLFSLPEISLQFQAFEHFDPYQLELDITPDTILETLAGNFYLKALLMSLKLNERKYIDLVLQSVPSENINLLVQQLPLNFLKPLLGHLSLRFEKTVHLEYDLIWILHIFNHNGYYLRQNSLVFLSIFRALKKHLILQQEHLTKISNENRYTLTYLSSLSKFKTSQRSLSLADTDDSSYSLATLQTKNPFDPFSRTDGNEEDDEDEEENEENGEGEDEGGDAFERKTWFE